MASETEEVCDDGGSTPSKVVDEQQAMPLAVETADDKNKSPRHPRWTRQETFTLIEGKKVAENRGRRGRKSSSVIGSDQVEPKWDSVSSYCKQRAVNRGPIQCRKRWSNMVGDFKKIKAWEAQVKEECESYWVMRNDLRKENKLPGFFDKEVFDVLDGKVVTKELALVTVSVDANDVNEDGVDVDIEEADVTFDSGRRATSDDGLFPDTDKMDDMEDGNGKDHDNPTTKIPKPVPISEVRYHPFHQDYTQDAGMSQDGYKRRRVLTDESQDKNFNSRLLDVLEKNASMLNARMEAENTNSQLDRDQRKDYNDSLVSALNKISDALTKIADKL
ncbi:hypothetical protein QVD17_38749 [Tagetes erecta]|uniref:Myb-like domain-containing protein n=1 Tax=Tagetes erecta TaxID=13708 RepID=A0AAD8JNR5_TARER|nr:hypothetical protein QVD17_38749 [Tagetes erecta]